MTLVRSVVHRAGIAVALLLGGCAIGGERAERDRVEGQPMSEISTNPISLPELSCEHPADSLGARCASAYPGGAPSRYVTMLQIADEITPSNAQRDAAPP
jgi:hypothetical protein